MGPAGRAWAPRRRAGNTRRRAHRTASGGADPLGHAGTRLAGTASGRSAAARAAVCRSDGPRRAVRRGPGVGRRRAYLPAPARPGRPLPTRDPRMTAARENGRSSQLHRQRPVLRIVVIWLLTTAVIVALGAVLSGINVKSIAAALTAAALIGLLNALVWPLVLWVALPLTVMTLGLGVVVLNGGIVLLASAIAPGFEVASLSAGIATSKPRSEEHTSELQSRQYLVCRLLLEKKRAHV